MEARPAESVTVKVPFAFTAGNRLLPAGTYRIELLTKGQPGVDELEVIALRGVDVRSYTAIITRLGSSPAQGPVMNFVQQGDKSILAEVLIKGHSFALSTARTDYATGSGRVRLGAISQPASLPSSATAGHD